MKEHDDTGSPVDMRRLNHLQAWQPPTTSVVAQRLDDIGPPPRARDWEQGDAEVTQATTCGQHTRANGAVVDYEGRTLAGDRGATARTGKHKCERQILDIV